MKIKYEPKDYLNFKTHTAFGMSIHTWLRLLLKNRFAIDPRYWPKALFITSNMLINAPVQLYEYLRYSGKIKRSKVEKPIFILGHPRSGTTYLHYILSRDPNFAYCSTYEGLTPHVFLSGGNAIKKVLDSAMPETRPQDNVKAGVDKPKEEEFAMGLISGTSITHGYYFPKNIHQAFDENVLFTKDSSRKHWQKHFSYFIKKLAFKYPGKNILLKSPANTGRVKEILEVYPDARFIHIYRDPYMVYLSNERLYEKTLPILGFHRVKDELVEDFILYSYQAMHDKYFNEKNLIPKNQLIEFSYEDFVKGPLNHLEKAYQELDLGNFTEAQPHLEAEIKAVRDYKTNTYKEPDEALKTKIRKLWQRSFEEFGY